MGEDFGGYCVEGLGRWSEEYSGSRRGRGLRRGTGNERARERTCFCCIIPSKACAVAGFIPEASICPCSLSLSSPDRNGVTHAHSIRCTTKWVKKENNFRNCLSPQRNQREVSSWLSVSHSERRESADSELMRRGEK